MRRPPVPVLAFHVSLVLVFVIVGLSGTPAFLLALTVLPVYHLATNGMEDLTPRAGALACGLAAAAALVWWEYGWWFEMTTMDKGAFDVELTLRRILFIAALVLACVHMTITVILHQGRNGNRVGPPSPGRAIDLAVLASPALVLLCVDDGQSRFDPGWTGWLALAVAVAGAGVVAGAGAVRVPAWYQKS
ncbi:hypothetical protein ACGFNU_25905 [Spirillospora sp. NPDC048911]|uniref:hypothetical protein n=1 Tax=Spirillospora sp. NPDC048911 TaxID=3364527 RepID=UPI0037156534